MDKNLTLIPYIEACIRDNWEHPALTNFRGFTFLYRDVARKIAKLHILFESAGLKPGDKIALCGRNSAQWCVAMMAIVTYGAVAVPILQDFKPDSIHHLVNHSESRLLLADNSQWENLDPDLMPEIQGVLRIADFDLLYSSCEALTEARGHLNELFGRKFPDRFTPESVCYYHPKASDLMLLNYTSGSTGSSKGVMLPHRSLRSNVDFCRDRIGWVGAGDPVVSLLPLAHMYGLTVDLFYPFCMGCHIHFLTRTPAPRIIMKAMGEIRPKMVCSVPLVLEKVIRSSVLPMMEKRLMRLLLKVPGLDTHLMGRVRATLINAFGGNLQEIILGGAPVNREIEEFLDKIHFPYANGYGMTECGPFITYMSTRCSRIASCGPAADRMELRVDSPDPEHVPGVLWVRGDNVMDGYYKNLEVTEATFRDGWMNTGDVCTIDADGFLYIRGRDKNMILGSNGQNIYPEEIESKLNNMPYVSESLIIDDGGRLTALICPDLDAVRVDNLDEDALDRVMNENLRNLNTTLPAYSHVTSLRIYNEEFEKTAKRSIKRYLYK